MRLTKESHLKLQQELEYLQTKERPEVANLLKEAIEQGDLSENAAYEQAKERQSYLEARIHELKNLLSKVEIIQEGNTGVVTVGSTVRVQTQDGAEREFIITDASDANPAQGKISYDSPLGGAFLGQKSGQSIHVTTPAGKKEYKILGIS